MSRYGLLVLQALLVNQLQAMLEDALFLVEPLVLLQQSAIQSPHLLNLFSLAGHSRVVGRSGGA